MCLSQLQGGCIPPHVVVSHCWLVLLQDCEIQVYGYKGVGDPQCLWTFCMKDSVLALDTEVDGGRVSC